MLQEQGLHPSILAFTDLEVVGRIQVQERIRLDGGMRVKGAALDHQVEDLSRILRAIAVQLYGMARGARGLGKDRERGAGTGDESAEEVSEETSYRISVDRGKNSLAFPGNAAIPE